MKQLLLLSIFAVTSLVQCNDSQPEGLTGIDNDRIYYRTDPRSRCGKYGRIAYGNIAKDSNGEYYNCKDFLGMTRITTDGSFDPEELMYYYMECASRYPRTAEIGLLNRLEQSGCIDKEIRNRLSLLLDQNFKFSPTFIHTMITAAHNQIGTYRGLPCKEFPVINNILWRLLRINGDLK